jgi:hypothetical protein
MPLDVAANHPTLLIRKAAFDAAGLTRAALDERLGLTPDEFNVEGELIAIGPVFDDDALTRTLDELETAGLQYFDDYFEMSGNWPEWLRVFVMAARTG